jgi:spermidine synthase
LVWLAVCFTILGKNYLMRALTEYEGAEVLAFRESPDATFAVLGYEPERDERYEQLVVNGTSYANNRPPGRRYMSALAHVPALLHPAPRSALIIAIGTGTTAGALTLHPDLQTIWAVDIARDVFRFAPYFVPLNHRFTESPKVHAVVADGRHFLLSTDRRFDLLTFEPPPPIEAGVVNLYSREFYRVAKRRMNPGAVLCQWMPLDVGPERLPRMMLKTLMAEFPHVSLWIPNRMEGVAIASEEPLTIEFERLRERMAGSELQSDMSAYGLGEPEQLLATFLAADQTLAGLVGDVPLVTDDEPRIEYFNFYPGKLLRYDEVLKHRQPINEFLRSSPPNVARLRACQEVMTDVWYAHELVADEQFARARERLEHAVRLDPNNRYLSYLLSSLRETK